ncbi:MAG: type I-B CRISPR-associated protein Cas7/Cst2/DevR [Thermoflexus sp.]|uniref:type I-B CRISPR-associated protein Cas7/Cst2/DevR n=1 Tax=Thermoflexus sp. TaxID=1969742 RepID=UPI0025DA25E4|nr:type I-B CRISPR-associated protein Cas7/Cst2/DevR [Thermoflexus sp.]MCS6962991.1 type I-B CRISPR-associated protein Cas7/Cst2/DevR [Thermoflexus sp.]MDW8186041.1 type I-B CRISPR-associated protein Cas7/Cst2/DevR [Anaerolineae bacterium]
MSKAIVIGYLFKVSAANVNASHTEGNVVVAKKITLPDGSSIPYISGQALRRMLRDRLEELGYPLSEPFAQVSGQEVTPPVRPQDFIDEDLFGYLDPSGQRRRTSPVRVSTAVGLFPFQGDRDLGTRSFERFGQAMGAGGNMFETELYANLFRGTMLIELDRVGVFRAAETGKKTDQALEPDKRRERLRKLLEALGLLWGGGRTARMLADLSPKFLAYTRLRAKHPVFLEALLAQFEDGHYLLKLEPLANALRKYSGYLERTIFGIDPGVFGNEAEIRAELKNFGPVLTIREALTEAQKDVDTLWSESSP